MTPAALPAVGRGPSIWLRAAEGVLSHIVWMGVVLVLLTPFIVSPQTIFPFVVGKALYSRSLIVILFVCWVLLALLGPSYRPPRSRLLVLLAVVLGTAVLSACLGVSVQRSFWSTYERMLGVVDLAHWFAFAVVLVSMIRTPRDWRILLLVYLLVGCAVALLAIGQYFTTVDRRATFTLGNPVVLGTHLQMSVLIALGWLAFSFHRGASPSSREPGGKGHARGRRLPMRWIGRCFAVCIVLIDLWALTLTGSRGALLALLAGLVCLAALYLLLASRRRFIRLGKITLSAVLLGAALVVLLPALHVFEPDVLSSNPLAGRLTDAPESVMKRLAAWRAGARGFADHPVFGWGPENYIVVLGRYGSGLGAWMQVHDHSHNKLVEELTTKGLVGLLGYLAMWLVLFHSVVRAGSGMHSRRQVPVLFAGATLMGHFVQSLTAPDSTIGSLQFTLLFAFVVFLGSAGEGRVPATEPDARVRPSVASPAGLLRHRAGRHGVRILLAVGMIVLGGACLSANQAIYSASRAIVHAIVDAEDSATPPGRSRAYFERAISDFAPLANYPRLVLFQHVENRWNTLRTEHPAESERMLALVNAEAAAAVASEPENWRIHVALARMYAEIGATEPEYRDEAERHRDRASNLAPNRTEVRSLAVE